MTGNDPDNGRTKLDAPNADAITLLDRLIGQAKEGGAEAADAVFIEGRSLTASWRMGKSEGIERSEASEVGLRVLIGKKQAVASSTDLSKPALDQLVERVVAMAKSVPDDPHCGLAEPGRLASEIAELDLQDAREPNPEDLVAMAASAEDAARAVPGVTNSEGAEASAGRTRATLVASNGFEGSYATSRCSISASVLAGSGTGMERDYDFATSCFLADLERPEEIGRRAGMRAVRRLNPRKAQSAKVPVVYEARIAGGLLRHFANAINGASIARGTSFLKDRLGSPVFGARVTVTDDPLRPRGLRSRPFDGEGVATSQRDLIADGVLTSWILDSRSARQLELETTGHASRGAQTLPRPQPSNLYLAPGSKTFDELIADIPSGFFVTELMGMGVNTLTGDYSRGAAGFWIERGEIAYPVSEITVAGNLKDMYASLVPANDLVFRYGIDAPTLRIEGMTVAGR